MNNPNDLLETFCAGAFPGAKVMLIIEREASFEVLMYGAFGPTTALGMSEAAHTAARVEIIGKIQIYQERNKEEVQTHPPVDKPIS